MPIRFCHTHPTEPAVARALVGGKAQNVCQLCKAAIDAKWTIRRGDPCWEEGCTEGVAFKLSGPTEHRLLAGILEATIQVTTFLCPTHTITHSIKDPALIIEEL